MTRLHNIFKPLRPALLLALFGFLLLPVEVKGQTDVQLTQYWAMPSYYNPASIGCTDYLKVRGAGRLQWLGIENAPMSFLGTAEAPFKLGKKRLGVGINAMGESLGLFRNIEVNVQLTYKFNLLKGQLGIGVQGGYFNQKFKGTEVVTPDGDDYHQSNDEAIPTQDLSGHTMDLGAGLWYNHRLFWVGASVLHILQPSVTMNIQGTESTETQEFYTQLPRMAYFMGGCNINIKNTLFELQPSFLVSTDFNSFTAEITARGIYNHFLSAAVGYRWKDAVTIALGAEFKNFFIGYSFDYPLSAIGKATAGSHEIMAGYSFKLDFSQKNKNRHRSIRIM